MSGLSIIDKNIFAMITKNFDGRDLARLSGTNHWLRDLVNNNPRLRNMRDMHHIRISNVDEFESLITMGNVAVNEIYAKKAFALFTRICRVNHKFNYKRICNTWYGECIIRGFEYEEGWRYYTTENGDCICVNDYYGSLETICKLKPVFDLYANTFPGTFTWTLVQKPFIEYNILGTKFHRPFSMIIRFKAGVVQNIEKQVFKRRKIEMPKEYHISTLLDTILGKIRR